MMLTVHLIIVRVLLDLILRIITLGISPLRLSLIRAATQGLGNDDGVLLHCALRHRGQQVQHKLVLKTLAQH